MDRNMVGATSCKALVNKILDKARDLIANMAVNAQQFRSK